ncbi:MAG: hypothetical protein AAGI08_06270 [Bacteroidota bacterium]
MIRHATRAWATGLALGLMAMSCDTTHEPSIILPEPFAERLDVTLSADTVALGDTLSVACDIVEPNAPPPYAYALDVDGLVRASSKSCLFSYVVEETLGARDACVTASSIVLTSDTYSAIRGCTGFVAEPADG